MSSAVAYIFLIFQFSIEWQLCLTCPTNCRCIAATNTVDCTSQRFTVVPHGIPHDTVNLVLHENFIFELYQTSFANLTNIEHLDLSLNNIVYIENYTFQAMTQLRTLKMDSQYPGRMIITPATFYGPTNLTTLNLSYIWTLEGGAAPDFGNTIASTLQVLDLSNNFLKITSILPLPKSYELMSNLHTLILDDNPVYTLESYNANNLAWESIVTFSCNTCLIYHIDQTIARRFVNLRFLYLMGNIFQSLDELIVNLATASQLTILDLSAPRQNFGNRKVFNLTAGVFKPLANTSLRELHLRQCFDGHPIPAGAFDGLYKLTELSLNYSRIANIDCGAFRDLASLSWLFLTNAVAASLPPAACLFPANVEMLILDGNKLDGVHSFGHMTRLSILSISGNIGEFPFNRSSFSEDNSVTYLNISHGKFVNFEQGRKFPKLAKLQVFDMSHSELSMALLPSLPFHEMHSLQELLLGNCFIDNLPQGLFHSQSELRHLDLSNNLIALLKSSIFSPLTNLEVLRLDHNDIRTINESFKTVWQSPVQVNLSENPFNCSCDMFWFRRWMEDGGSDRPVLIDSSDYICTAPVEYADHAFVNVTTYELERKCTSLVAPLVDYTYVTIIASVVTAVGILAVTVSFIIYKKRWFIRGALYRWSKGRSHIGKSHMRLLPGNMKLYDAYVSYEINCDSDWADEFVAKLEHHLLTIPSPNTKTAPSGQQEGGCDSIEEVARGDGVGQRTGVYYEKRDALSHLSEISQLSEAIFTSRNIIVALSISYSKSARCQYELHLVQEALVERYGSAAHKHLILVVLKKGDAEKLHHLIPRELRTHYSTCALVAEEDDLSLQRVFWHNLCQRLA
jgi:Leucine-rich repeat (LRR) protein